ncbi:hypothetical protein [Halorussus sp. AFM4]
MDDSGGMGGGPPPVPQNPSSGDGNALWLLLPIVVCFVLLVAAFYVW